MVKWIAQVILPFGVRRAAVDVQPPNQPENKTYNAQQRHVWIVWRT